MEPKKKRKQRAKNGDLCHLKIMTKEVRHVVTSITVITAKPALDKKGKTLC